MIRTTTILWLALAICAAVAFVPVASAQSTAEAEVLKVEDAFRVAKLQSDVDALRQILADDYIGMNQYGARRNKAEVLDLFRTFKISKLTRSEADVRFSGDVAIVLGSQEEVNPAGKENLLFTRVYVKRDGRWRLLSSTQLVAFSY